MRVELCILTSWTQVDRTVYSTSHHVQCRRAHNTSSTKHCTFQRRFTCTLYWLLSCLGRLRAFCIIHRFFVSLYFSCTSVFLILHSLEMFARMAVCGVLLDPDVPVSNLFTSLFSSPPDNVVPASSSDHGITRNPSIIRSASQPAGLSRGLTLTARLRRLRNNLARPFALAHHSLPPATSELVDSSSSKRISSSRPRSDTVQSKTPMMEKAERIHSHVRNPSQPTFFSNALRSDNKDILSLPFRLSVQDSHTTLQRNLPYLRHSWTRIDFIAIVSFWICFVLAVTGAERGTYHIGIFRALSVLRTTRLLAITSGTTVRVTNLWCRVSLADILTVIF